jgi:CheY-like chemotaxis protein
MLFPGPSRGARSRGGMELKQASILLVDDEPFLREIMGEWLARVAGQVFCAEDGAEALKILAANKIDLILSDVRMPVMDGISLLKNVKKAGARTPGVIFITGFSDVPLREAYDMGAEAILEKPITREELLNIAQRALAEAGELWRGPPGTAPEIKLKITFDSLTGALQEKRIAFGRRGFCIDTPHGLSKGPVEFAVEFRDDRLVLSGQGVVRWIAPEESKAGIEITCLDDASRTWVVDHVERSKPLAFIPAFAGLDSSLQTDGIQVRQGKIRC